MGRLVLWLALAVLLPAPAILQPLDQAVLEEQEQMRELLTSMFIDNHREGRDLEEGMEEEGEAKNSRVERSADEEPEDVVAVDDGDDDEIEMEKEMETMEVDRMGKAKNKKEKKEKGMKKKDKKNKNKKGG